jgi:hypothetical protein
VTTKLLSTPCLTQNAALQDLVHSPGVHCDQLLAVRLWSRAGLLIWWNCFKTPSMKRNDPSLSMLSQSTVGARTMSNNGEISSAYVTGSTWRRHFWSFVVVHRTRSSDHSLSSWKYSISATMLSRRSTGLSGPSRIRVILSISRI